MAKNWIPLRQVEGTASRQAHVRLPEGTYEREISKEGFFGPSAQFHHQHKPTDWVEFDGAIRPRAFDLNKLATGKASPWALELVMANPHLQMRIWKLDKPMAELARNSDGDQLLFIHEGEGALFCDYGHLDYRDGDYLGDPARHDVAAVARQAHHGADGRGDQRPFHPAGKGLVGRHAIFDPAMLDTPRIDDAFTRPAGRAHLEGVGQAAQPALDRDLPVQSAGCGGLARRPERRAHQLARPAAADEPSRPSAALGAHHLRGRAASSSAPSCRGRSESDPEALRLPFFHNNDDFDEIIFYHKGSFFSRDNIHPGMMTVHPVGLHARPASQGLQRRDRSQRGKTETDEVAVMIDTRDAVDVAAMPAGVEFDGYVKSWRPADEAGGRVGNIPPARRPAGQHRGNRTGRRSHEAGVVEGRRPRRHADRGRPCAQARGAGERHRADPAEGARRLGGAAPKLARARRAAAPTTRRRAPSSSTPRRWRRRCRAPIQWADGSAYVVHVELVRKARGVEMPPSFWTDPLMYQGGSDSFIGPNDDIEAGDEAWGIDFEGEIGVIVDDVPMGIAPRRRAGTSSW